MKARPFWMERIRDAWSKVPIVWLTGVRRAGKTVLARSLNNACYLNSDLPRHQNQLLDPEFFFGQVKESTIILDEIHQLRDPSGILKIAADEFPHLKILATGSSTLSATQKFRDSLTGRKRVVHLMPVLATELQEFGVRSLERRLLVGGLPQRVLSAEPDPEFYAEWLDSYFARDIQELFHVGKRNAFLRLAELLIRNSGQLTEVTSLAKHSGLTRPTVNSYLEVMQMTHLIRMLRPFSGGGRREILAQPKCYAFDTGFVCHFRGWESLRPDDCGPLLEHLVLDLLVSYLPAARIGFWRDKQQREIDFVIPETAGGVTAIECKWSPAAFTTRNLEVFRAAYPAGKNILVTAQSGVSYTERRNGLVISVCNVCDLPQVLRD